MEKEKLYTKEDIKTAEDHAYFAGEEKLREELLEWAKVRMRECENKVLVLALTDGNRFEARDYGTKRDTYRMFIEKLNSL